ncbi:MAG: SIS domain-containing protein, partial [Cyanobacteria bacterium J06627_15]
ALHAAMVGEYLFENLAKVPTEIEYASEFRYRNPIVEEGTVVAAISQSGQVDLCFASQSCILGPQLWDTSRIMPDKQFPGVLFKVLLGYRDHLYLLQAVAYIAFLLGVGGSYFRSLGAIAPQTTANPKSAPS